MHFRILTVQYTNKITVCVYVLYFLKEEHRYAGNTSPLHLNPESFSVHSAWMRGVM